MHDRDEETLPVDSRQEVATPSPRDVEKLFSALNLNHSSYRSFENPRITGIIQKTAQTQTAQTQKIAAQPDAFSPEPAVVLPMPQMPAVETIDGSVLRQERLNVALYSPMGGSGKSLLAASLGALLCHMGSRVLLVDTSPWQTLALHYGARQGKPGVRTFHAPGTRDSSIHVLASDNPATTSELDTFTETTSVDFVLFDLGGLSEEATDLCLRMCDRVIVPLLPTSSAPMMAYAARAKLQALGVEAEHMTFVLNLMDQTPVSSKVRMLLSELLQEQLFPGVIERQPMIHEALEEGIVLPFYAPTSQAANVCREIVRWFWPAKAVHKRAAQRWSEA